MNGLNSIYVQADWVLPVSRHPIRNGVVGIDDQNIVFVGTKNQVPASAELRTFSGVIMPGLVNAHTHLELSGLSGAVKPGRTFPEWVASQMQLQQNMSQAEKESALNFMMNKFSMEGIVAIGDVANNPNSFLNHFYEDFYGQGFLELIGFHPRVAEERMKGARNLVNQYHGSNFKLNIAPHAPYSVSQELLRLISQWFRNNSTSVLSVHCAENREEIELLMTGNGPWKEFMQAIGSWNPVWKAPGMRPVAYLDSMQLISERTLLVHCVHVTKSEIKRISARKASVCWCPTSNLWLKVGRAPVMEMLKQGINIALGTDSIASNPHMSLWQEMAEASMQYPELLPEQIVFMATLGGARGLRMDHAIGSLMPGKSNRIGLLKINDIPDDDNELYSHIVQNGSKGEWNWLADLLN